MKKLLYILIFIIACNQITSEIITYKVKEGDTIFGISLEFGVSAQDIIYSNKLNNETIKVGQNLNIEILNPDEYRVKSGDTLSLIAYKNNITLKHLLLVNRIDENYILKINEIIKIPTTPEIKKKYTVNKGDSLSWISMTYNIGVDEIIKLNKIKNKSINIGDELILYDEAKPKVKAASVSVNLISNEIKLKEKPIEYIVLPGDTISAIALEYQTSIDDILKLNKVNSDNIKVGQKLLLPYYSKKRDTIDYNVYHEVVKGDTLSGISLYYNISETLLKELNNLNDDRIVIGQKIKLIPQESRSHKVEKGDTLWSIANKYNISVDQIMQYNHLNSTLVEEGKTLTLYDYSVANHENKSEYNLVSYLYNHNTTESQPNKSYSVDELINPLEKFNQAKDNWKKFSSLIEQETLISNDLKGWTFILDPGHGGKDPGAIATVKLNGKTSYIVEDEYAYDTAVRLYELLKRNGAEVHMTILSPDHITRNPSSNYTTFLNEKNEVYNNYNLNKINNKTVWPVGGQWGLDQRVIITNNILSTTSNKNTVFISLHADNDIERGVGKLVLFDERYGKQDYKSKAFAESLISELGSDATVKPMTLAVLNNNNADVKVLIELRNMIHLSEAMLILDNKERQNDALMILNGIKSYIKSK